jgi:hypothetical protein
MFVQTFSSPKTAQPETLIPEPTPNPAAVPPLVLLAQRANDAHAWPNGRGRRCDRRRRAPLSLSPSSFSFSHFISFLFFPQSLFLSFPFFPFSSLLSSFPLLSSLFPSPAACPSAAWAVPLLCPGRGTSHAHAQRVAVRRAVPPVARAMPLARATPRRARARTRDAAPPAAAASRTAARAAVPHPVPHSAQPLLPRAYTAVCTAPPWPAPRHAVCARAHPSPRVSCRPPLALRPRRSCRTAPAPHARTCAEPSRRSGFAGRTAAPRHIHH